LFYLYRIHKYELNPDLSLNAVISLNPDVLKDAEARDKGKKKGLLYGMPILLKDNIGYDKLPPQQVQKCSKTTEQRMPLLCKG
jgi:amidase